MSSNAALDAVERLRRLSSACETAADRSWLSVRLRRYLDEAPAGIRLEDALDLAAPGRDPWWRAERRRQRDGALREMAARFCPARSVSAQAAWLQVAIRRYAAVAWLRDGRSTGMPPHYEGSPKACLFRAFQAGPVPTGLRQLRAILQGEQPVRVGSETP